MKKNLPIIPLILSVTLGLASFVLILNYLNQIRRKDKAVLEKQMKIKTIPTHKIIVSKQLIEANQEIEANMLEFFTISGDNVPKNVFEEIKDIEGKFAIHSIPAGNIVQKSSVNVTGRPKVIQDIIPNGMRAVSLQISGTVMDFIKPGDKVDVLAEYAQPDGTNFSKVILQDILVLAKGNQIGEEKGLGGLTNSNMLTFALSVKQAEAISALGNSRKLRAILRGNKDQSRVSSTGTSVNYLLRDKRSSKFIY